MCEIKKVLNIIYDQEHPDQCLLDMYLPQNDVPCPVFVYFHGGGLEAGHRTDEAELMEGLAQDGIAVISADYRLYPDAHFPDFLNDAAKAFAWAYQYHCGDFHFNEFYLGGASAGGYIAMMLYFDSRYLGKYHILPNQIAGYVFDGGQPTVHFNALRERGEDIRAVRLDEAAPLYFINKTVVSSEDMPRLLFLIADNDLNGRLEQTQLLLKTMEIFGYDTGHITFKIMQGFSHSGYISAKDENGESLYRPILRNFIIKEKIE